MVHHFEQYPYTSTKLAILDISHHIQCTFRWIHYHHWPTYLIISIHEVFCISFQCYDIADISMQFSFVNYERDVCAVEIFGLLDTSNANISRQGILSTTFRSRVFVTGKLDHWYYKNILQFFGSHCIICRFSGLLTISRGVFYYTEHDSWQAPPVY